MGEPCAGDVGGLHVGGGADGGQAFLDLGKGRPGAGGEARAGQLGAVDDVDVQVEVDRGGAELAKGDGDGGRVGGDAADLAGVEGVALGGVEVTGVGEDDAGVRDGSQAESVLEEAGVRPVSMASAMPPM